MPAPAVSHPLANLVVGAVSASSDLALLPPRILRSPGRLAMSGKRFTERQASSAAENVMGSFATFGEIAIKQELEATVATLKTQPALLFGVRQIIQNSGLTELVSDSASIMTLATLAADGTLKALLTKVSAGQTDAEPDAPKEKVAKRKKLRITCKKVKHLGAYADQVVKLALANMEPETFTKDMPAEEWPACDLLSLMAWATDLSLESPLPSQYTQKGAFVDEAVEWLTKLYQKAGAKMKGIPLSMIADKAGWYNIVEKTIVCSADKAKVVQLSFADTISIKDKFDLGTEAMLTMNGQSMTINLAKSFTEVSLALPDLAAHKNVDGFEPQDCDIFRLQ